MTIQDTENTNKPLALILMLLFHGILAVVFILIVFRTPIPPFPEVGGGSGLQVNLGNSENGMGNVQPEELIPMSTQDIATPSNTDDNIITSDDNNTVAVNTTKNPTEKKKVVIQINDPINKNALYKGKTKNEGETGKAGDQGNPNGDPNVKNHYGTPGDGKTPGIGVGDKPGISVKMNGRTWKSLPKPKYNSIEQGKVVVSITVDRNGNVTKAKAGAKGTTADQSLWKLAEDAALKAKFNAKPDAAEEQKGTITYNFVNLN